MSCSWRWCDSRHDRTRFKRKSNCHMVNWTAHGTCSHPLPTQGLMIGYWSYLWWIHVSTNWLEMDLLCPYYWGWICRPGNIHLSTGDQPRHHPRTKSKEITKRNGQSKPSFCIGITRHRTATPHLITQTSL